MNSFRRPYAALAALAGLFALALQFRLMLGYAAIGASPLYGVLRYFSLFTVFTNALATLCLIATAVTVKPDFLTRPGVQSAVAVYFVVMSAVYTLLLRNLWHPSGAQQLASYLLHYTMPLFYLVYWLLFVPKGTLRYRDAPVWLLYPAIYVAWALAAARSQATTPIRFSVPPRSAMRESR